MLFESQFSYLKNIEFKNRVLRSSIGGRMAHYDGTVSTAWTHFEKRFARAEVAGIISATISINKARMSPLEYPSLHANSFMTPLKAAIREIKKAAPDCRYVIQIGDTGGHTHTSAFPQSEDGLSSSAYTDVLYGYRNRTQAMTIEQIARAVRAFAEAARRVRETGCDGIEITASKGYLLHQFLNPGVNRRRDAYGGSVDKRFRIVEEVIRKCAVRSPTTSSSGCGSRQRITTICPSTSDFRSPGRCGITASGTIFRRRFITRGGWRRSGWIICMSTVASASPTRRAVQAIILMPVSRFSSMPTAISV